MTHGVVICKQKPARQRDAGHWYLRVLTIHVQADVSGVHRHVEVDGNEFPFSRGASFYEVNSNGQIVYGRDLVEPALKPGSSALLVRYIAPFVGRLPGQC